MTLKTLAALVLLVLAGTFANVRGYLAAEKHVHQRPAGQPEPQAPAFETASIRPRGPCAEIPDTCVEAAVVDAKREAPSRLARRLLLSQRRRDALAFEAQQVCPAEVLKSVAPTCDGS